MHVHVALVSEPLHGAPGVQSVTNLMTASIDITAARALVDKFENASGLEQPYQPDVDFARPGAQYLTEALSRIASLSALLREACELATPRHRNMEEVKLDADRIAAIRREVP